MQKANLCADQLEADLVSAKAHLEAARQRMRQFANKNRRYVEFDSGELVWLSSRNLNIKMTAEGTRKLLPKWIGPFPVADERKGEGRGKVNSVAYRLVLPKQFSRVHNVFHVSLLKKYTYDERHVTAPLPELDDEGDAYWPIERILDHRVTKKGRGRNPKDPSKPGRSRGQPKREYLIRWVGHGVEWDSWEPEKNIAESEHGETIRKYFEYLGIEVPSDIDMSDDEPSA